ncbi:uncharacterized protein KY384_001814 [Bacidia gigantensis]|uniref:uncharacterized protein n=1 Tax=Bacidia gigantensis TaxID=2732470 RepID=UPI001D050C74|nr:uncharacterized protein KY384_001814 [Bacidia gigantensis]KAG8533031.1 hypothetical protein KY384_001814 [Bacidia gigantensis]
MRGPDGELERSGINVDSVLELVTHSGFKYPLRCTRDSRMNWLEWVRLCKADLCVALFLSQLHNLEYYSMTTTENSRYWVSVLSLFRRVLCNETPCMSMARFEKLKSVDIDNNMQSTPTNRLVGRDKYSEFSTKYALYLPSLTSLRGTLSKPFGHSRQRFCWPVETAPAVPLASMLTNLSLRGTNITFSHLEAFLRVTPSLTRFDYEIVRYVDDLNVERFYCKSLIKALKLVAGSLQSLRLSTRFEMGRTEGRDFKALYGRKDLDIRGNTSFRGFSRLDKLEIPIILLLGSSSHECSKIIDQLPQSLQRLSLNDNLTLYRAFEWRSPAILKVLEKSLQSFSTHTDRQHLHFLELIIRDSSENPFRGKSHFYVKPEMKDLPYAWDDWDLQTQKMFHKICANAGLRSQFRRRPLDVFGFQTVFDDDWVSRTNPRGWLL